MGEGKGKEIVRQWVIPFGVFAVVATIILLVFVDSTSWKERAEVETGMTSIVGGYAVKLQGQLESLKASGNGMSKAAGYYSEPDDAAAELLLSSLNGVEKSYMTMLCNKDGDAICQIAEEEEQQKLSLADFSYFADVKAVKDGYIYVADDGITGKSAAVCVTESTYNNRTAGYILQYYDLGNFRKIVKKVDFDLHTVFYLTDKEGNLLAEAGETEDALYCEEENLWDYMKAQRLRDSDLKEMQGNLYSKRTGLSYVTLNDTGYVFIHQYTGIEDWCVIAGVPENYVDRLISKEWRYMEIMIISMIALMVVFGIAVLIITITTKKRSEEKSEKIEVKADTDLLTELNNKLATERKIKEYMEENPDGQGMMFLLDIDNFKKINDTMGHAFGDEVLRTLGLTIKAEFRASDIIGRTGGDEFMIFLKDIKDESLRKREAARVEKFFQQFHAGEYVKYAATASIGVAVYPKDAQDFEGLYKAADNALYTAKRRGKNQLAFYGEQA